MCSVLALSLTNNLYGKFDKVNLSSVDSAWRLSRFISDDPPTDAKCLLLQIISLCYWPEHLNRSRISLTKLRELAPRAKDKAILQTSTSLLAKLCLAQADFISAVKYASAALEIDRHFEQKNNSESQQENLLTIARATSGLGLHEQALEDLKQLHSPYEQMPPPPALALDTLEEQASELLFLHRYQEAYDCLKKCKQQASTLYGTTSVEYAQNCQLLGWAAMKLKKFDQAESELLAARRTKQALSLDTYDNSSMLSRTYQSAGKPQKAHSLLMEFTEKAGNKIQQQLMQLTLAEQIALLNDQAQPIMNQLLTACSYDPKHRQQLYARLLEFRGMLTDSINIRSKAYSTASSAKEFQKLEASVDENRRRIQSMRATSAINETPEIHRAMDSFENSQRQALEFLLDNNPKLHPAVVTPQDLRKCLRKNECLVDTYKYLDLKKNEARYCSFLTRANQTEFVDLGPANKMEQSINTWIKTIRVNRSYRPTEKRFKDDGTLVAETARNIKVYLTPTPGQGMPSEISARSEFISAISKLKNALKNTDTRLIICSDGELFRVPWSLVFGMEKNCPLVAELDSPKQLLNRSSGMPQEHKKVLLVGNVDFSSTGLPPLAGTKFEMERICKVARGKQISITRSEGNDATKTAILKQLGSNDFVHLATHALFMNSTGDVVDDSPAKRVGWLFSQRSPLLDSVLFVAAPDTKNVENSLQPSATKNGAAEIGKGEDSELSATEIAADEILKLDLSHTQHVALSACETGLGETFRGQGVIGMRSAFVAAGARTILMSLWPVDDAATGELMACYYDQLWNNRLEPAEALRCAQNEVEKKKPNPYYWAGWTITGRAW